MSTLAMNLGGSGGSRVLAFVGRMWRSATHRTDGGGRRYVPPQAVRDYDVTDEGCEAMRRRFADSFAEEVWDDVDDEANGVVRNVASR